MRLVLVILLMITSFVSNSQLISESFTSGTLPSGWSQSSVTFTTTAGGYANFTSTSASLTSPTFDAATFCSIQVVFDVAKFGSGADGPITVEYSLDNGATWITAGTSPTPTGSTYVSATIDIFAVSATMKIRLNSSASGSQKRFRNFSIIGIGSCGSSDTITAGSISGGPFNVDCNGTSANGTITYTSSGSITSGNTFTIQLSDASGSFLSPTIIGTVSSTAANGTLNFIIPDGIPTGNGYLIRILATNPVITSSSSSPFTITQLGSCALIEPYISSIIYDGCDGACGTGNEGLSEIIFGNTGSYSMLVNSANIDLNYTTGSYHLIGTVVNNSSTTTALNTAAGCPGLFVDAIGITLPPDATFLMVSSALCVNALTWSDLCGQGPIYLIYGNSGTSGNTWHNNGNFGNSGGGKNFTTTFTTTTGTFTQNYNYAAGSPVDGNYATFVPGVGTPATQGNFPNCTITPTALSSELIEYRGELVNNQSLLTWKTASERANAEFILFHSTEGVEWRKIGSVLGNGTTNDQHEYSFTHVEPSIGMNYYKLFAIDFNGQSKNLGIVPIKLTGNFAYYNATENLIIFNSTGSFVVVSMDGKIVAQRNETKEIRLLSKGIFIVQNLISGEKQRLVIY